MISRPQSKIEILYKPELKPMQQREAVFWVKNQIYQEYFLCRELIPRMARCMNCIIYGWNRTSNPDGDGDVDGDGDSSIGEAPALRSCSQCKVLHYCSQSCQV